MCKNCGICDGENHLDAYTDMKVRCIIPNWVKRSKYSIDISGWSKFEVAYIIDAITHLKYENLNVLSDVINRPLDELVDLLTHKIKIGNKPLLLKVECAECGLPKNIHMSCSKKNGLHFCDYKCYWKYKKHDSRTHGKNNCNFNSEYMNCSNCGKEMLVPKWRREQTNSFGENHVYCCNKCYYEFRSKHYVGERSSMAGRKLSDEQKDVIRMNTLRQYKNGIFNRETKPQKIVNEMLTGLGINYEREETVGHYSVDNYLCERDLIIEVMGDYFHTNPIKFPDPNSINDIQKKGIVRDKRKRTYIHKYRDINVLYLWESDIIGRPEVCIALIMLYVKQNGIIPNYNSFNYLLDGGELKLQSNIISPYFEVA